MPGINTNPSFFNKLMGQAPGMTNALAQNFGDPSMQGAVQGASSLLNRQKQPFSFNPRAPQITNGIQGRMPGQNMGMPSIPPPVSPGIQTGPSPNMAEMPMNGESLAPPPPVGMSRNILGRNGGNTGISGGAGGGLFGAYNRMRPQF